LEQFQEFKQIKTGKMKKEQEKEQLTIEQRIEGLKAQQEQAKEVFIKCTGAIEMLEQMMSETEK
jgi:hypothetical protein